jgi:hypothetical protein
MYEISLVPDVKAELIHKLKVRNLVFLICVIVVAACCGLLAIVFGVVGGQGLTLSALDTEMVCRSTGPDKDVKKCETKYGTAILKYENGEDLLTIQDQMNQLAALNSQKIKFSRIFNILDTIRPDMARGDANTVLISEISTDIDASTIFFDAIGYSSNNIGYSSLEAFKKNATRSYFDFGSYMRYDDESGSYVEIPSFCIEEVTDDKNITYGIYSKGAPGCEAPMVEKSESEKTTNGDEEKTDDETADNLNTSNSSVAVAGDDSNETTAKETEKTTTEVKKIKIRRTYIDEKDLNEYKNGNDRFATDSSETVSKYYFESSCLKYDDKGKFDEASTLEACPLLSSDPVISNSAYGPDEDNKMALTFSAELPLTREVFLAKNKHMLIVSPSRQNVTDSYIQVSDMFAPAIENKEGE